jgi:hypothetical protein
MVAIIVGVSLGSNLLTTSGFYLIKLYRKIQKQNKIYASEVMAGHAIIYAK